jgi:hypothetical protein
MEEQMQSVMTSPVLVSVNSCGRPHKERQRVEVNINQSQLAMAAEICHQLRPTEAVYVIVKGRIINDGPEPRVEPLGPVEIRFRFERRK